MSTNKILKNIISNFNFSVYKKIDDVRFKIPLLNAVGAHNIRRHENWMVQLMRLLLLNKDSIFIDIGANIGQTLLKIKSIDLDIPYYGFEPNPVCIYYLQQLVRANKLKNCNIFPVGLGDAVDIKELFIFFEGDISSGAASTIVDLFEMKPVYTDYIPVFTLDYFKDRFFKGKKIDLVKLDVENGELEVLKGALKTIENFKPFIISEILPIVNKDTVTKTNERKAEMQSIMKSINYYYYKIIINKNDQFIGLKPVIDIVSETADTDTSLHYDFNYLIMPTSKNKHIERFLV